MKVLIDSWAWLEKAELGPERLDTIRKRLTIRPRKVGDHPGPVPKPLPLFKESDELIGVPRQYFLSKRQPHHDVEILVSSGDRTNWPGNITFNGSLEADQDRAVSSIVRDYEAGNLGGILQAAPGFGKTVCTLALVARLNVPTLVVVHKDFLVRQWVKRIKRFLPDAKVGIAQQKKCEYKGKHIVIGMVDSIADRQYDTSFYNHFGLVVTDEVHRIGAATWSSVPPRFPARYRLGISATPRRKDGAQDVFFNHIGPIVFKGSVERLPCKVKRVFSPYRLPHNKDFNETLLHKTQLLRMLCANGARNQLIVDQIVRAVEAKRKVMVLSERLDTHLRKLHDRLMAKWPEEKGPAPSCSFFIGGLTEEQQEAAEEAQVIFATAQLVTEGLDIPAIDTLILATPLSDIEQAVGRIQRPCYGKKEPIVVDIHDDNVPLARRLGNSRWKFYKKKGWVQ